MSYNVKNYTEPGGEVSHFGGKIVIEEGCKFEGMSHTEAQEESTATTVAALKDDFNALLQKLKAAGLMSSTTTTE